MGWYRTAFLLWNTKEEGRHLVYQVPVLCDPDNNILINEQLPMICLSAMQIVTGKKSNFWTTCIKAVQSQTIPQHGLIGKPSNSEIYDSEVLDDLRVFFVEVESFCDVIPTRFV